jgi:small subunit ribosomal protein S10e
MLISKQTRIAVYSYLFKEGTMVVQKDKYKPKHSDELPINNLEVMCLLRSFSSKGYVNETFNWGYYYYYLTAEGIEFLRQYLALPDEIVPATMKKISSAAPGGAPPGEKKAFSGEFKPSFGGDKKDGYRK